MTFYREGEQLLTLLEARLGAPLPPWLVALRSTLAGAMPGARLAVQFDSFDEYQYNAEDLLPGWYTLGLLGYLMPSDREFFHDQCGIMQAALWERDDRSQLAISMRDPSDPRIHQFSLLNLLDAPSEKRAYSDVIYPAFRSWASMLGHVVAVKVDDIGPFA